MAAHTADAKHVLREVRLMRYLNMETIGYYMLMGWIATCTESFNRHNR